MEERKLGPVVGLGTSGTFGGDSALAREVVSEALAAGSRLVDTSPMYGEAEASLAVAFEGRRDEVTLATKIWAETLEEGREQYRRQLEWFGGDVQQIHNLVNWQEHLEWIEAEREAGRVGMVGVTHWNRARCPISQTRCAQEGSSRCSSLTTRRERECERELLPIAEEQGLAVIVMRPFADGGLLGNPPPPEALEPLRGRHRDLAAGPAQVGALRRARRRRHPRNVEAGAHPRERWPDRRPGSDRKSARTSHSLHSVRLRSS